MNYCSVCGKTVYGVGHTNFSFNIGTPLSKTEGKSYKQIARDFYSHMTGNMTDGNSKNRIFEYMTCASHYINMIPEIWEAVENLVLSKYPDYQKQALKYPAKEDYTKFKYEIPNSNGFYAKKKNNGRANHNQMLIICIHDSNGNRVGTIKPKDGIECPTDLIDMWYQGYAAGYGYGQGEVRDSICSALGIDRNKINRL